MDVHRQSIAKLASMGENGKALQLLIIILPDITGSYGDWLTLFTCLQKKKKKRKEEEKQLYLLNEIAFIAGKIKKICETELGIVSQCCQPRQALKLNNQYFENVALKINVKVCNFQHSI